MGEGGEEVIDLNYFAFCLRAGLPGCAPWSGAAVYLGRVVSCAAVYFGWVVSGADPELRGSEAST